MKLKSEVIQMRKWLLIAGIFGISLTAGKARAVDCLGGGCVSPTVYLSSSASGVTAGAYTNANITVDVNGRVTSAANGTGGGGSAGSAGDSITSSTLARVNGNTANINQIAIAFQSNTSTKTFMASDGKWAMGPTPSSATSLLDLDGGSITVRGTNAGIRVFSGTVTASEFNGAGDQITGIIPTNIVAGKFGSSVIADSISVNSLNAIYFASGTFSGNNSIKVSSLSAVGAIMAAALNATNSPTDTQVPKYDAATGKITWSADNTGGSSGLPLPDGSTTYILSSTAPTSGVLHVTSGTVDNSLTVKGNLNVVGVASAAAVAVNGTGPLVITGGGTNGIQVGASSTTVLGDFIANSTDTYDLVGRLVQAGSGVTVFSTPTLFNFGEADFNNTDSTGTGQAIYVVAWGPTDASVDPISRYSVSYSTGKNPNPINFSIAIATINTSDAVNITHSFNDLPWTSTFTITNSTVGVNSSYHAAISTTAFTNWKTVIGAGNKDVFFKVTNIAGAAQDCQRAITHIWADKQKNSR